MSNFKVGDKVVRKAACGEDGFFLSKLGRDMYYTVTSVTYGGGFLQIDGLVLPNNKHPWCACNFELYKEPEDELPPVPDSVMYFNSVRDDGNDQHLVVERTDRSDGWADEATGHIGLKVAPRTGSTRAGMSIGINLTPDAALQLAHDIRRMAMSVKREQK
ncbi:putative RecT family recombinase [Klebsiella phage vB_KpnP_Dlv622]|uniref:Putative RecT family recombinase n=1 Tax=Klebsiella phage vB_KpnP_Dlv622 TaxID=2776830 RepID=A0A7L8ZIG8_9CAUD|nr:putative RecT family recombinase [Klebsiella phage vB_KpnP_Dlv622]